MTAMVQQVRVGAMGARRVRVRDDVAASPVRLTARGRVAAFVAVFVLAVLIFSFGARAVASVQNQSKDVRVQPGQTLSQIAHEAYPTLPVADAVARVQVANDLNSQQLQAGQLLRLPS